MAYASWDAQAGPASALLRTSATWSAAGTSYASSGAHLGLHLRPVLYLPEAEPSALEGAVDVLRQQLSGGAPAATLAPRRRGCARCVSCATFAPLGAQSARRAFPMPSLPAGASRLPRRSECTPPHRHPSLRPLRRAEWPGGILSPAVYYGLRARQLAHYARHPAPAADLWRAPGEAWGAPPALAERRGLALPQLRIPVARTNVAAAEGAVAVAQQGDVVVPLAPLDVAPSDGAPAAPAVERRGGAGSCSPPPAGPGAAPKRGRTERYARIGEGHFIPASPFAPAGLGGGPILAGVVLAEAPLPGAPGARTPARPAPLPHVASASDCASVRGAARL
jgi:hypothetical protein